MYPVPVPRGCTSAVFTKFQLTNSFGSLSSLGDSVYLLSGDGTNWTGYGHGFQFGPQLKGVTFGRHITSEGSAHFAAQ